MDFLSLSGQDGTEARIYKGDASVDEGTRLFLWVLLSCLFFAALGGVFGAVTGVLTWRDGRAVSGGPVPRRHGRRPGRLLPGWGRWAGVRGPGRRHCRHPVLLPAPLIEARWSG